MSAGNSSAPTATLHATVSTIIGAYRAHHATSSGTADRLGITDVAGYAGVLTNVISNAVRSSTTRRPGCGQLSPTVANEPANLSSSTARAKPHPSTTAGGSNRGGAEEEDPP
ncbi:hypothetical protein LBMAG47_15420 [Planctomycetia bacterium]|nr:hypothetical protein LBMAG47_15420 [Planctomycetia bacterium]